jgi:hypothetical protein
MILLVEGGRRKKDKGKIGEPDSLALVGKKDSEEGKKTDQGCRNNGKTAIIKTNCQYGRNKNKRRGNLEEKQKEEEKGKSKEEMKSFAGMIGRLPR